MEQAASIILWVRCGLMGWCWHLIGQSLAVVAKGCPQVVAAIGGVGTWAAALVMECL